MDVSSIINCVPRCQTVASDAPPCDDYTINNIVYRYKTCTEDSLVYAIHKNQLECICINNLLTDCRSGLFYEKCTTIFMASSITMTAIILLGMILNLLVCFIYCGKKSIHRRIPNVLFVNQAIADLVNCVGYALISAIAFLIIFINKRIYPSSVIPNYSKEQQHPLSIVSELMFFVSCSSSLLLYLVITCDRWLAFSKNKI